MSAGAWLPPLNDKVVLKVLCASARGATPLSLARKCALEEDDVLQRLVGLGVLGMARYDGTTRRWFATHAAIRLGRGASNDEALR